MAYLEFLLRGLIVFTVLYLMARILSKKLISQMTLFDFIAGITLGSMTEATFLSPDIPLVKGIGAIVLFSGLVLLIDIWTLKSFRIRKFFNSEPTMLIDNGNLLEEEMAKVRFTVDELIAELRKKDVFHFQDVQSAVLETDGTVSVLKKMDVTALTAKDMNIHKPPSHFPQVVIIQGNILEFSLKESGYDRQWLDDQLLKKGILHLRDVIVAQVDGQGNLYVDTLKDLAGRNEKE